MLIIAMSLHNSLLVSDSCSSPKQSVRFKGPVVYPSLQQQLTLECICVSFSAGNCSGVHTCDCHCEPKPRAQRGGQRSNLRDPMAEIASSRSLP